LKYTDLKASLPAVEHKRPILTPRREPVKLCGLLKKYAIHIKIWNDGVLYSGRGLKFEANGLFGRNGSAVPPKNIGRLYE
jgi:hypothetical protein